MDTLLLSPVNIKPSASATNYQFFPYFFAANTTDNRQQIFPVAGVLSGLRIDLLTAPGTGTSYTFTVMLNGSATDMVVNISDTATSGTYSGTLNIAAGDLLSIRSVPSGTPVSDRCGISVIFIATNSAQSIILGNINTFASNTTTYYLSGIQGYNCAGLTSERAHPMPCAGTFTGLYVYLTTAPGTGKSRTFTLRIAGADSAITVTISGTAKTAYITGQSVSISAGDLVDMSMTPAGGSPSSSAGASFGLIFEPSVNGESVQMQDCGSEQNTSGRYTKINGGGQAPESLEADTKCFANTSFKARKLYSYYSTYTATGDLTNTLRKSGADTTLSATVIIGSATIGSDTANEVDYASGDVINLRQYRASGTASAIPQVSFVTYIEPPAVASGGSSLMMMGIGA